jgi:hypothetical protein
LAKLLEFYVLHAHLQEHGYSRKLIAYRWATTHAFFHEAERLRRDQANKPQQETGLHKLQIPGLGNGHAQLPAQLLQRNPPLTGLLQQEKPQAQQKVGSDGGEREAF